MEIIPIITKESLYRLFIPQAAQKTSILYQYILQMKVKNKKNQKMPTKINHFRTTFQENLQM